MRTSALPRRWAASAALFLALAPILVHSANAPAPAVAAGYLAQTFGPSVSMGKNWYDYNFYRAVGMGGVQNADGSVTIPGTGAAAICTAYQDRSKSDKWSGAAFGGGGYFEATLSFAGADDARLRAWPAFWANDIENMSQNAVTALTQWPGQPAGYGNWIEVDVFEYNHHNPSRYGIQIHNWYGRYSGIADVRSFGSAVTVPPAFDWSQPHKFGFLWVPAAAGSRGYANMYLDDAQVGPTVSWTPYDSRSVPPPKAASTAVGVLDTRHLAMILSADLRHPMTIFSMSVWQASAAKNIVR